MGEEMKAGIADNGERSTMYQKRQMLIPCYYVTKVLVPVYLYCTILNLVKVGAVATAFSFFLVCIYLRGYFWIETQQFLSIIYMRSSPCRRCLTAPSKYPWNMS